MSCKVTSINIHGVKLIFDVSLETSTLEDLSKSSLLYRTFPLTSFAKGKEIKGELWFKEHENSKKLLEIGVTMYDVEQFLAIFNLNLEDQCEQEKFAKSCRGKRVSYLSKTSTNQKLPKSTSYAICRETFYVRHEIGGRNIKVSGKITLKIDFVQDSKANQISKCELTNFKSLICKDAFDQLDKNFKIVCQGEEFHFNKTVLSMVSEVFAKMVQGPFNKEATSNTVEIIDFSPETIRNFQKFAFENEELKDIEINMELLMFAQKYLMKPLVAKCKKQLFGTITHENVFDIIKTSFFIDDEEIFKKASKYLKANSEELKDTDEWMSFEETNPKIMIKVLKMHY